jgi:hypothetical protein
MSPLYGEATLRTLNMEIVCFSETLAFAYETTRTKTQKNINVVYLMVFVVCVWIDFFFVLYNSSRLPWNAYSTSKPEIYSDSPPAKSKEFCFVSAKQETHQTGGKVKEKYINYGKSCYDF